MKSYLVGALIMLGISLFCGVIVISIGLGSLITPLNQVAKPFVCGSNDMQVVQHVYSYRPGETSWSITAYCVDAATSVKTDVTGLTQFVAGVIYSVIPLVVLIVLNIRYKDKATNTPDGDFSRPEHVVEEPSENKGSAGMAGKLETLKKLRESNLITEDDYQKKKNRLLDNL
jgi:hypothetical protein